MITVILDGKKANFVFVAATYAFLAILYYLVIPISIPLASAKDLDFSGVPPEDRQMIENACRYTKGQGPAAYYKCLENQLASLSKNPAKANLSGASSEEKQMIENACRYTKGQGPAAYYKCLEQQLASLSKNPAKPNLSGASSEEKQMIENACRYTKGQGPAAYYVCLKNQLTSLGKYRDLQSPIQEPSRMQSPTYGSSPKNLSDRLAPSVQSQER